MQINPNLFTATYYFQCLKTFLHFSVVPVYFLYCYPSGTKLKHVCFFFSPHYCTALQFFTEQNHNQKCRLVVIKIKTCFHPSSTRQVLCNISGDVCILKLLLYYIHHTDACKWQRNALRALILLCDTFYLNMIRFFYGKWCIKKSLLTFCKESFTSNQLI